MVPAQPRCPGQRRCPALRPAADRIGGEYRLTQEEPPGREYPQTNGWTFWGYQTPDGTHHLLDELRRELYERKVIPLSEGRRTG